jgi:hypothetical protein
MCGPARSPFRTCFSRTPTQECVIPDSDPNKRHPGLRSKQVSYRTPIQTSVIPDSDPGSMVLRGDGPRVFARGDMSEVFALGDKSEGFALVTRRGLNPGRQSWLSLRTPIQTSVIPDSGPTKCNPGPLSNQASSRTPVQTSVISDSDPNKCHPGLRSGIHGSKRGWTPGLRPG